MAVTVCYVPLSRSVLTMIAAIFGQVSRSWTCGYDSALGKTRQSVLPAAMWSVAKIGSLATTPWRSDRPFGGLPPVP